MGLYYFGCRRFFYLWGGHVNAKQAYPYQLERKLAGRTNRKYRVINAGVCEYNSNQVLFNLPDWIERYEPDIVLVLVGAADRFNFIGHNFHGGFLDFISNLRIYGMARMIGLNLRMKIQEWRRGIEFQDKVECFFPEDESGEWYDVYLGHKFKDLSQAQSSFEKGWYYYTNGKRKEAIKIIQAALKDDPESAKLLVSLGFFCSIIDPEASPPLVDFESLPEAIGLYEKAYELEPDSKFILSQSYFFYDLVAFIASAREKYDLAVRFLTKAVKMNPKSFDALYELALNYSLQSNYDADYIVSFFQQLIENNPELRKDKMFMDYLALFEKKEERVERIDRRIYQNLNQIVRLCQNKNIEVIIKNYPRPYFSANRMLENIAQRYSLFFVDNYSVFKNLLEKKDAGKYFIDYEHCTPEGHRIMSKNAYNTFSDYLKSGQ